MGVHYPGSPLCIGWLLTASPKCPEAEDKLQNQTLRLVRTMSALPPIADMRSAQAHVR
jgi:hypothetical protein